MSANELSRSLPDSVRALGIRLGASLGREVSTVRLQQRGKLRTSETSSWLRFSAEQDIALASTEFRWRAKVGPLGVVRVVDELQSGKPMGSVSLIGILPLAKSSEAPSLLKGEVMRYLAELAWAPDAVLRNMHLTWEDAGHLQIAVSTSIGGILGRVIITLDADGCIGQIEARDRPRLEDGNFVEHPWRGRFWDYRSMCGRRIPHQAEVSWFVNGAYESVWIGSLVSWEIF